MYGSVSALSESLVLMELANVTPVSAGVSRLNSGADGGGADARPHLSRSVIATRAPNARIHTLGIGQRKTIARTKSRISLSPCLHRLQWCGVVWCSRSCASR